MQLVCCNKLIFLLEKFPQVATYDVDEGLGCLKKIYHIYTSIQTIHTLLDTRLLLPD